MKAVQIDRYGGPEVLSFVDVPEPKPAAGQVLIEIAASGVNFIDTYQRSGLYQVPLPAVLGMEAAGVVLAVGEGVTEFKPGMHVAHAGVNGAYAERQVVPADRLVPVPAEIPLPAACALMLQGMTAHYLAVDTFPLKAGDVCLVHAAAGGVGQLLTQIAKARGATVLATVSTEAKAEIARRNGADQVILYSQTDFEPEVMKLTGGKGANVVYDSVGKDTFERSVRCVRPRGLLVLFGQSSGPIPAFDPLLLSKHGSLFVTRPTMGHYTADRGELLRRAHDIFEWYQTEQLRVEIGAEFGLTQAADAHRALEGRKTTGKVLLEPSR